jgi:hypothetical protein
MTRQLEPLFGLFCMRSLRQAHGKVSQLSEFLTTDPEVRFDSRRYQIFSEVVGLERGPLSLMSTSEELLERKVAAPV